MGVLASPPLLVLYIHLPVFSKSSFVIRTLWSEPLFLGGGGELACDRIIRVPGCIFGPHVHSCYKARYIANQPSDSITVFIRLSDVSFFFFFLVTWFFPG